jgi:uracil-DNA glycosylase
MGLFDLIEDAPVQESAEDLIRSFRKKAPCSRCSLSEVNPTNKAFIYRGSVNARIAVLTDSPFSEDAVGGTVFAGPGRHSWERVLRFLNRPEPGQKLAYKPLIENDFFMTFVAQCRTDKDVHVKTRKKGKKNVLQVDPENANKQDLVTCFNFHAYQVLKALPNLEVILATGKIPVQMLLKEDFQHDRHVGNFFISDFFPKVPVFCLDSPRYYDIASDYKTTQLLEDLRFFKYKYLETGQIRRIHAYYKECADRGVEVSLNHAV